jgi:hypothetical protein
MKIHSNAAEFKANAMAKIMQLRRKDGNKTVARLFSN